MNPTPCPNCGDLPIVSRDDQGKWDAIHPLTLTPDCGNPMALNWDTRDEAVESWNLLMRGRAKRLGICGGGGEQ